MRAPRWPTRLPVRYQVFHLGQGQLVVGAVEHALARDVGPGGLFLAGPRLAPGARLHLYCVLDGPPPQDGEAEGRVSVEMIEAWGEVAHREPRLDAHSGALVMGVGVRVTRMSPGDQARLERFLDERRAIAEATRSAATVRVRAAEHHGRRRIDQPRLA